MIFLTVRNVDRRLTGKKARNDDGCSGFFIGTEFIEDEDDEMVRVGITANGEEAYIRIRRKTGAELAIEKWNTRAEQTGQN